MTALTMYCIFTPFVAGIISAFLGKYEKLRNFIVILATFISLGISVVLSQAPARTVSFSHLNFQLGGFNSTYTIITAFMWFAASLLSPQYFKNHNHKLSRYYFFFLITMSATLGVFLSADLMTTFIFFEIMSFTSYMWVIQDETKEAMNAGKTYLAIAVLGGMVALMGLFMLYNITGTLMVVDLHSAIELVGKSPRLYVAAFCLLFGFGAKAGMFPLHIWLPKAHPVAPAPASALLSGVLTKTGVFGILIVTGQILRDDEIWGYTLLSLATITMVLGAVIAVFSNNLKRTLACSSLSQIGFILVGVSMITLLGEENSLAANGTFLYMINHSIVKLVLFLAAGAIYLGANTLDLNKLKGYGRNKPVIMITFLIGACSLAGIPGFTGYLSKTLVHEAIVEYAHLSHLPIITIIEWLFLFSGGLTIAYSLKLFIAIFIEKPTEETPKGKKLSPLSAIALIISAVALPVIGVCTSLVEKITYPMLSLVEGHHFHHEIHYFSFTNLKGVLISLAIGILVYLLFIRKVLVKNKIYVNPMENKISLEEQVYIPLINLLTKFFGFIFKAIDRLPDLLIAGGKVLLTIVCRAFADSTDFLVYLSRKSVLSDAKEHTEHQRKYAYALGDVVDHVKHDKTHKNANLFVRVSETISKTTQRISSNFSFALFMTCFGVCIILVFLIISFVS